MAYAEGYNARYRSKGQHLRIADATENDSEGAMTR
jgi:hypothetical protein